MDTKQATKAAKAKKDWRNDCYCLTCGAIPDESVTLFPASKDRPGRDIVSGSCRTCGGTFVFFSPVETAADLRRILRNAQEAQQRVLADLKRREEEVASRWKKIEEEREALRKRDAELEKQGPQAKLGAAIENAMTEMAKAEDRAEREVDKHGDGSRFRRYPRGGWMMTPFGPMPTRG
jgi:hypothetical protein